jgi:hypothetical protein
LNPPKIAIAPIAPFVGNHQLSGNNPVHFSEIIESLGGVGQQSRDPLLDTERLQAKVLGFPRQAQIEIGDDDGVGQASLSDLDVDASC